MGERRGPEYDTEISASVSADELTFHEVPEIRSRVWGKPEHEGTSGSERTGLPQDNVRTGVVHKDIRVDHRLASRLRAPEEENSPEDDAEEEGVLLHGPQHPLCSAWTPRQIGRAHV